MGWVDGSFGGLFGWAQQQQFQTHQATRPHPGPTRYVDLPIDGGALLVGQVTYTTAWVAADITWTTLPSGWAESAGFVYAPVKAFWIAAANVQVDGGSTTCSAQITTSTDNLVYGLGNPAVGDAFCGPGALAYSGPASQGISVVGSADSAGTADIAVLLYRLDIEGT